jgi:hypothetical protein
MMDAKRALKDILSMSLCTDKRLSICWETGMATPTKEDNVDDTCKTMVQPHQDNLY